MPIVQPVYGPDYGKIIRDAIGVYQGVNKMEQQEEERDKQAQIEQLSKDVYEDPAAWNKLKALSPERAAQLQKIGGVNLDRFYKYRAQTALEIKDLPPQRQAEVLANKAVELRAEGRDPAQTLEVRQRILSGDKTVQDELRGYVEQGYQTGYLERPPQEKKEEKYITLTPEEARSKGLDPKFTWQQSPQGKFVVAGGKGQTINVNTGDAGKVGTVPPGYALRVNPQTGLYQMYEIQGGPVAKKTVEQKKAENKKSGSEQRAADIVLEDIGRLINLIEREKWYNPVTGISAQYIFSNIPGTARADSEALRTTISTNIGFDRLQRMRDESPTGGALGQVSEIEMKQLMSVMGSLDLNQSDSQILYNLRRLNDIYKKIKMKADAYPNAEKYGFGEAKPIQVTTETEQGQGSNPVYYKITPEIAAERYK
jgi:hypothetical protein